MSDQVKREKSELSRLQNNLIDQNELLKKIDQEIRVATEASEQAMFKADHDALTEAEYKVKTSQGTREKVVKYIEDLNSEIENQYKAIEDAETQVRRDQFADILQTKLNNIEKPLKAYLRAEQNRKDTSEVLSDTLEENGLSNDEYFVASLASDLRHHTPQYFKTEYIDYEWRTSLQVSAIHEGKLGQYYKPEDETLPFDKAFQSLFLKPLLNQIDGLRAGTVDLPEPKTELVEAKPIPKIIRKTIDILQHFYVTYENKFYEPEDKVFYAFSKHIVLEAVADAAIEVGYALDTSDPDYEDKLKRYNLTVTDKPIKEHEVSLKNTPHLGDPGGFL